MILLMVQKSGVHQVDMGNIPLFTRVFYIPGFFFFARDFFHQESFEVGIPRFSHMLPLEELQAMVDEQSSLKEASSQISIEFTNPPWN